MAQLRFTILGCGSSGGVPRIGGLWGACDPSNPKNLRQRCSMLVERITDTGVTTVLIDTPPEMRQQLLSAQVAHLDGVIYTHSHADHVHGIDDLRMVYFLMRERIKVWADGPTQNDLLSRFGYAFVQPDASPYPPILDLYSIDGDVHIDGAGGTITLSPVPVGHGMIDALGFRIGGLVYMPDVAEIYDESWPLVEDLDVWVLDALRRKPHPTHTHFERSLEWMERARPKRGILTNMHIDMDYDEVTADSPGYIEPAFDGMVISLPD